MKGALAAVAVAGLAMVGGAQGSETGKIELEGFFSGGETPFPRDVDVVSAQDLEAINEDLEEQLVNILRNEFDEEMNRLGLGPDSDVLQEETVVLESSIWVGLRGSRNVNSEVVIVLDLPESSEFSEQSLQ